MTPSAGPRALPLPPAPRAEAPALWRDSFGRAARSLRLSVTDRCNLRCVYCMSETPDWLPREGLLTYEELARLAGVAAACGVRKVRLTGGEPLVRRGLHALVRLLRRLPLDEIALTTNGLLLGTQAPALAEAGLDRVTVSLDTLDPKRFEAMARRPGLDVALAGMDAAEAAGLGPLKVNAVVIRGFNDGEVEGLAEWARERGRELRFIEFMPLEGDRIWDLSAVVPAAEILRRVTARFPAEALPRRASGTAGEYRYRDGAGRFGIVAPVTEAFCGDCDRVRITSDGGFRTCLFASSATDLAGPLRAGASDAELAGLMAAAVGRKAAGHLISRPGFQRPDRAMNAIGG